MVIYEEPALFGSVIGPINVAPASRISVSPGCALSIALWRLPPAGTVTVAPCAVCSPTKDVTIKKRIWRVDRKKWWANRKVAAYTMFI